MTTSPEIQNSRFIYESGGVPCLKPTNVTPSNWFIPSGTGTPSCQIDNGGIDLSTDEVCNLVDILEGNHSTEPGRYFIDMIHLLNYYKRDTLLTVPDCIINSLDSLDPCGLLSLSDLLIKDYISNDNLKSSSLDSLVYHEGQLTIATSTVDSSFHQSKITETGEAIADAWQSTLLLKDSIYNEILDTLTEVSCTDSISSTWLLSLEIFTNVLLSDSLTALQIRDLQDIAALCADNYGDPIHWARDLLLVYNNDSTDYTTYDDCLPVKNRSDLKTMTYNLNVFPNPSSGWVIIDGLNSIEKSRIILYDVAGRQVAHFNTNRSQKALDLSQLKSGIYVIRIQNGDKQYTKKLVLTQ